MLSSSNSWTRFLHPMIDIVLHVEGKTFPANKSVLSQHSGYFRTVLSPNTTSLILPTVPAEYFALLLVKKQSWFQSSLTKWQKIKSQNISCWESEKNLIISTNLFEVFPFFEHELALLVMLQEHLGLEHPIIYSAFLFVGLYEFFNWYTGS